MDRLNRREFIRKVILTGGIAFLGGQLLDKDAKAGILSTTSPGADYFRIVILGDPHFPVREREVKDEEKRQRIIEAKQRVVDDINAWEDVSRIHISGDVVAQFGNRNEYEAVKTYFLRFKKPFSVIVGNHDYLYKDYFSEQGRYILADAETRRQKLSRFTETLGLSRFYYSEKVEPYLLLFLSLKPLTINHKAGKINWNAPSYYNDD